MPLDQFEDEGETANAAGLLNPSDFNRCRSAACRWERGAAFAVEKVRASQRWAIESECGCGSLWANPSIDEGVYSYEAMNEELKAKP